MKRGEVDLKKLQDLGAKVGPPVRLPPAGSGPAAAAGRWDLADSLRYQIRLAEAGGDARFAGWWPEHYFARPRRWRFDVAWPDLKVAVECEGGIDGPGGHTDPERFREDLEKYNAAALAGWLLLRVTGKMIASGEALQLIERALAARKGP